MFMISDEKIHFKNETLHCLKDEIYEIVRDFKDRVDKDLKIGFRFSIFCLNLSLNLK